MKYFFLTLAIIFAISTALLGIMFMDQRKENMETARILTDNRVEFAILQTKMTQQTELLGKLANPLSFPSKTSLERWAKEHVVYDKNTSYSEDAVRMMNLAREDGYFLGLVGVQSATDNTGQFILKIPVYPYVDYTKFYTFNVAIVGESDIYLLDPSTGSIVKTSEMKAKLIWGIK